MPVCRPGAWNFFNGRFWSLREKEIVIREATLGDYETLLRFEQGVISAERPFDPTLREGAIHYYDIGQLIASPDVHLIVAEDGTFLTGCGYARIEPARPFLKHQAYVIRLRTS